eukprot:scaffold3450_cov323-Prasinococcus_capsulatus_cf.AAC.5
MAAGADNMVAVWVGDASCSFLEPHLGIHYPAWLTWTFGALMLLAVRNLLCNLCGGPLWLQTKGGACNQRRGLSPPPRDNTRQDPQLTPDVPPT